MFPMLSVFCYLDVVVLFVGLTYIKLEKTVAAIKAEWPARHKRPWPKAKNFELYWGQKFSRLKGLLGSSGIPRIGKGRIVPGHS